MPRSTGKSFDQGPPGPVPARAGPIIIGIDPGLQRTGYAVIAAGEDMWRPRLIEAGVVRLSPRGRLESRLVELDANLAEVLARLSPQVLCCEQLYAHYKHPRTAILMGHARGVIITACARNGLAVRDLAATRVKRMLTGSGRAGKRQVQHAVAKMLRLQEIPEPHDVADAIAIALAGLWIEQSVDEQRLSNGAWPAGKSVLAAGGVRRRAGESG